MYKKFLRYVTLGAFVALMNCSDNNINRLTEKDFYRCKWINYKGNKEELLEYYKRERIIDERYLKLYETIVGNDKRNSKGIEFLPDLNWDGIVGK